MSRIKGLLFSIILLLAVIAIVIHMPSSAGAHSIGIGVEFNTHATPAWIALHEGLFSRYSINLTKVFKFQTGLELASAFARGDVQAGWVCLGPALVIANKGIPIKIVAKVHNYGYGIVVSPKIASLKDLDGKKVYCPGKGSPAYLLLLKIEDEYGLKFKKAFAKPQAILSALLSGQIDAAALPEHRPTVAESKGLKVLLISQDIWPNMPGSYLVVKEELIKRDPEVIQRLIEINKHGLKVIKEKPDYAAKIAGEYLGISEELARRSLSRLEFNSTLNVDEIQRYIDFMHSHGIIKKLNASDLVYVP